MTDTMLDNRKVELAYYILGNSHARFLHFFHVFHVFHSGSCKVAVENSGFQGNFHFRNILRILDAHS